MEDNKLQTVQPSVPSAPGQDRYVQAGNDNVLIPNYGTVNINVQAQPMMPPLNGTFYVPLRVNREYYNLFVIGIEEFDKPYFKVPRERVLNQCMTDETKKRFEVLTPEIIEEIKERIRALQVRGVNTLFLHDLIDECEQVSRLRITKDFRIFLIDYNNMEVRLSVLPKAVFLLFLHHPEGIRFKELADYYSELLQIYLKLNPIGGRMRQEQSIRDITNPCSNSINEKCARIREAFVSNFDERLAKNYFITGNRGEPKRIALDPSMVIWE